MERYYVPKYINALPQILWWELDEFAIFLSGVILGILSDHSFMGAVGGFLLSRAYMKLKYRRQPGFMFAWLYSKGLWGKKGVVPDYWIKEFVE